MYNSRDKKLLPKHFENDNKHLSEDEFKKLYSKEFDKWTDKLIEDLSQTIKKDVKNLEE